MRFKMKPESVLGVCCSVIILVVAAVVFPAAQVNAQEFKKTFIERCRAFREQQMTCDRAWKTFKQAYVGKDDSEVSAESYDNLFTEAPFKHPCGGTMLWSGIQKMNGQDIVHKFTKNSGYFFTLEDTLLGYVLDGLTWCGKKNSTKTFTKCEKDFPKAVDSFWAMASIKFAAHACGVATLMLDGEKPQPFSDKSFLARFEIPHLQPGTVKQLTIVLITESNRHQCNNESVKNLENMLPKEISSVCKEVTKSHIEGCIRGKNYKSCW